MTALKERYRSEIVPQLQSELGLKNVMAVPRISKITLNMGVGEAVGDKKVLEHAVSDMEKIAGQKPIVTKSRKSIAGFKIRDGWPIGCKVTLRDERMYEFLDRLINIAIPRIRDFRGISPKQFDGRGNFAMGVTEQIIFPEIDYDQVDKLRKQVDDKDKQLRALQDSKRQLYDYCKGKSEELKFDFDPPSRRKAKAAERAQRRKSAPANGSGAQGAANSGP